MVRAKVKLAFIENKTARKITYQKRVRSIMKHANELSILCGVETAAVVFSEFENGPVTFPSSEDGVRQILTRYRGRSEMDKAQKKLNHEEFLKKSITTLKGKIERLDLRHKELEMENLMCELLTGKPIEQVPYENLDVLIWVIEDRLRAVNQRILHGEGPSIAGEIPQAVNPAQNLHNQ